MWFATFIVAMLATSCAASGWGFNEFFGAVGDGTTVDRNAPVSLGGGAWGTVDAGARHSCGIRLNGSTWCWGDNTESQVGDGTTVHRSSPTLVGGDSDDFTDVSAGGTHTCALRDDATMWCWGNDFDGQLGDGSAGNQSSSTPAPVIGQDWVAVSAGGALTCGIKGDATLWCWGFNRDGAVGDGTYVDRATPTQVAGEGWVAISVGGSHACGLRDDGSGWCWGANFNGQLGVGASVPVGANSNTPRQVTGEWASLVAGGNHTCGFKVDGSLWCWGRNHHGQLGDGTTTQAISPIEVAGNDWSVVSPGGGFTCALRTDDTAWCWGENYRGQLGDGTNDDRLVPTAVVGGQRWIEISAGGGTVTAIEFPSSPPSG